MKKTAFGALFSTIFFSVFTISLVSAQPYGAGKYNEAVPYGDLTTISISADTSTTIPVTPATGGVSASGNNAVTVTSTDVSGFQLYVRADSNTSLANGGSTIAASANASPAALATNTWGYNTDASSNFKGITLTDALIKTHNELATSGNLTTVTYGVKVDATKVAGNYSTTVLYTAVPQTN